MNLHETLSHKVGGLPMGAWVAAVAGGLGVSYYLRHRSSSADYVDPTIAPTTAETDGMGGAAVSDPFNPGNVSNPSPVGGPGTGAPIRNNNAWRQQMVKVMIGNGVSPLNAERAVHDFLAGNTLGQAEAGWINQAMATVGPPPSPPPKPSVTPPRKPKPKPKPGKGKPSRGRVGGGATGSEPRPKMPKHPKHHPIAHKMDKPARHHTHGQAHPHHRRDNGTHTNPGR